MKSFAFRQVLSFALGGLVALHTMTAGARAWAPGPATEHVPTRVQVDLSALELSAEDASAAQALLESQLSDALRREHAVAVNPSESEATMVVRVSWVDPATLHYAIAVSVLRGGRTMAIAEFPCAGCSDPEIGRAVEARLVEVEPALRQGREPKPAPVVVTPPPPSDTVTPPKPTPPPPTKPVEGGGRPWSTPLGVPGKIGLPVVATGMLSVVAGAAIHSQGTRIDSVDPRQTVAEQTDFRPVGLGVMVAGGVLAATGVALLVIDRVHARRRAPSSTAHRRWGSSSSAPSLTLKF